MYFELLLTPLTYIAFDQLSIFHTIFDTLDTFDMRVIT